jgi:hypothetical protein
VQDVAAGVTVDQSGSDDDAAEFENHLLVLGAPGHRRGDAFVLIGDGLALVSPSTPSPFV